MENSGTILRSIHHLGLGLLRALAQKDKGNVFLSPFSLSAALSMMYCGARGDTALEMKHVFGYEDLSEKDVAASFDHLLSSLEKDVPDSYNLEHANASVMERCLPIKDEYKRTLEESFHAVLIQEDLLLDPQQALRRINDWVRTKTHGKINSLLDKLNPNTVIVLLNAVYFKGVWQHQFEKGATTRQKFYNGGGRASKKVNMMHQKENFDFVEKETYKALQLPYQGGDIAMLILLPHSRDGLESLEEQLPPTFVEDLRKEMRNRKVKVALPRFRMEYFKSLKEAFQDLGVHKVFSTSDADLTGICEPSLLNVSSIHHKAVIEVNEEGSEASAATAVSIKLRSVVRKFEFVVDHPFLFTLYNTKTNLNIFMGRVVEL